jgi:Protein of unknown function (DUF3892)
MPKSLETTQETSTGRNLQFRDKQTGEKFSRAELVKNIEQGGKYAEDYYVRKINDVKTPVSKPDAKKNNNLG